MMIDGGGGGGRLGERGSFGLVGTRTVFKI